jgi:hypothetical protein
MWSSPCTDSRQQPPDDSKQCRDKLMGPSALHFITKLLGASLFACICSHRIRIE